MKGEYIPVRARRIEPGLYLVKILYTHVEQSKSPTKREFGIVEMEVISTNRPDVQPGDRRINALPFELQPWEDDWKFLSSESTRGREVYVLATEHHKKKPKPWSFVQCVFSTIPITTHEGSDTYRYKEIAVAISAMRKEGLGSEDEPSFAAAIGVMETALEKIWSRLDERYRAQVELWIEGRKKLPS